MSTTNNKRPLLGLGLVALVSILCVLFMRLYLPGANLGELPTESPMPVACTAEAKICPDGSSVGRSGPQCEFAACSSVTEPNSSSTSTPIPTPASTGVAAVYTRTLALDETFVINGILITPRAVVEDSRCPVDVQCIQAGTVRVKLELTDVEITDTTTLALGRALDFHGATLTFTEVTPAKTSTNNLGGNLKYQFTFEFSKSQPVTRDTQRGTLEGTVTIGPVCPVERAGEPCVPTAALFAAEQFLIHKTDQKTISTLIKLDANGKFSVVLPVGEYELSRTPGEGGPGGATGVPTIVVIKKDQVTSVTIAIDTGIR